MLQLRLLSSCRAEFNVQEFFLRRIKPELTITLILLLLIASLVGIVVRDMMLKKQIDNELNDAKMIISEVALNLSMDKVLTPIAVSNQFLKEKAPEIKSIIIYPDNRLEVFFNKLFINNGEKKFIFSFNSIDQLTRAQLKCLRGDVPLNLLPNQCRE